MVVKKIYYTGAIEDCVWYRYQPATLWWESPGFVFGAYDSTYYKYGSAARFSDIDIPRNSIISSAVIKLKSRGTLTGAGCYGRLFGEAVDDAEAFTNNEAAFLAREANKTTAYVDWKPDGWYAGNVYASPDIKTIIQEIVDRENWDSGNALVIFIDDYDDRSTHAPYNYRDGYSYKSGGAANGPILEVVYSTIVQTFPRRLATSDALDFLTSD